MYLYFDPLLIYGTKEPTREKVIDDDYVSEKGLSTYASDVVRGFAGNVIYGESITLEQFEKHIKTGRGLAKVMKKVDNFAKRHKLPAPTFMTGLSGSVEYCHETYDPLGESEEEEESSL